MNSKLKLLLPILLFIFFFSFSYGKSSTPSKEVADTTFTFKDDTLFANVGFKLFVGQKITIGKGSEDNGRYQTISFKSPIAIPLILFRKTEIANNIEYQANPSLRDEDKVKDYLIVGNSLVITKIQSKGNKKQWHYYSLNLSNDAGTKFTCNLEYALKLKELLIQHE